MPDDNSELEPPDSISNSVVKRLSADGSVGSPHVRVGHRQALIENPALEASKRAGLVSVRARSRVEAIISPAS